MAFPQVVTISTPQKFESTVGAHTKAINMPGSLVSGNLILVMTHLDNLVEVTPPTGFTEFYSQDQGGTNRIKGWWAESDGSEGATQDFLISATSDHAWISCQISGWDSAQAPVAATTTFVSTFVLPPLTTPWGGNTDNLWVGHYGNRTSSSSGDLDSWPSQLGLNPTQIGGVVSGWCAISTGELAADTLTPSGGSSGPSAATATIAIKPATGGGSTTKIIRFIVKDEIGNVLTNQTGLRVNVFDAGQIGQFIGPLFVAMDNATSDASGYCTINVMASDQPPGGLCAVMSRRDGSPSHKYGVAENVVIDTIEL